MQYPTLFLDRDGTINVDLMHEYLSHPDQMQLIPKSGQAICRAQNNGFKIAIVTNQAGVAKGLTDAKNFPAIHDRLADLIAAEGKQKKFTFDDIQICPHHPQENCTCRKPQIGMLEKAAKNLNSDLKYSFFIGDRETDLLCAQKFNLSSILVLTGHGVKTKQQLESLNLQPSFIANDLDSAVEYCLSKLAQAAQSTANS